MDEIGRLLASPDVIVGNVAALTETGSLFVATGSGSQLPGYSGGAWTRHRSTAPRSHRVLDHQGPSRDGAEVRGRGG